MCLYLEDSVMLNVMSLRMNFRHWGYFLSALYPSPPLFFSHPYVKCEVGLIRSPSVEWGKGRELCIHVPLPRWISENLGSEQWEEEEKHMRARRQVLSDILGATGKRWPIMITAWNYLVCYTMNNEGIAYLKIHLAKDVKKFKYCQWQSWKIPLTLPYYSISPPTINRSVAAYLNADGQVKPSLIYDDDGYEGLNHQGNEGVDAKHQGISFHAQINCDLKPIVKHWTRFQQQRTWDSSL